jgi:hypothetical protein
MEWVKGHGRLLMEPEYYLNELKGFERLPYFDGPGMSLEEKKQALKLTEKARITISRKFRLASLNENFIEDRKNSGLLKASLLFLLRAVFINSFLFDLYESNRRFKIFCINFKERLRLDK